MSHRAPSIACALVALAAGTARAATDDETPAWKLSATALAYFVPDQPDFVMLIAPVDLRRLHLEVRYNYEALRSGSLFAGVTGRWGETLRLVATPMIGGVFGDLDGVVPALRLTLTWWKLDLFSESELVVDVAAAGASFFYEWSELGVSPFDWLRFGVAVQRSRVFHTSLEVQRGLFVGATVRRLTLTLYQFNAPWTTPTWVGAVSLTL